MGMDRASLGWFLLGLVLGPSLGEAARSRRGSSRKEDFSWVPETPSIDPMEQRQSLMSKLESMGGFASKDPTPSHASQEEASKWKVENAPEKISSWGKPAEGAEEDAAEDVVEAKKLKAKKSSKKLSSSKKAGVKSDAPAPLAGGSEPPMKSKRPTVLVVTWGWWGPARFAKSMSAAGIRVTALCTRNNAFTTTRHLKKADVMHFEKNDFGRDAGILLDTLLRALDKYQPDLVLPMDDDSITMLRQTYRFIKECLPDTPKAVTGLLYRSLGSPSKWEASHTKIGAHVLAREIGVRGPRREDVLESPEAGEVALEGMGLPVVVKASMGSGGSGVRICRTKEEAGDALRELFGQVLQQKKAHKASRAGTTSALCKNRDAYLRLPPYSLESTYGVSLEQFIPGQTVNYHFAAWRGVILNGMAVSKVERVENRTSKPSTVQRVLTGAVEEDLYQQTAKLVKAMGYSGVAFSEWQLNDGAGGDNKAYLIEMNPRPGPNDAFSHLVGQNRWAHLGDALLKERSKESVAALQGQLAEYAAGWRGANSFKGGELITLFPEELLRAGGASPYFKGAAAGGGVTDFFDDDPALLCYIFKKIAQVGVSNRAKKIDAALQAAVISTHARYSGDKSGSMQSILDKECPRVREEKHADRRNNPRPRPKIDRRLGGRGRSTKGRGEFLDERKSSVATPRRP
mmetsp:Transcript_31823/g.101383  ORF Transcript_31823/g.101383 Transcript_31823/m.101383 type:complete len:686 (+) Transcript_31823:113-2170(+)